MAIATSVRPRSISLSFTVHAAALTALVALSALGPEPLPNPVAVASSSRMALDPALIRFTPRPAPVRPTPRLPSLGRRPALTSGAPRTAEVAPPVATFAIQETAEPVDIASAVADGGCTEGCVVGPSDEDPVGQGGVGYGSDPVVSVVQGGDIRAPRKVHDTSPIYPDLAIRSRLEGRVEIECRIDTAGRVVDATIVRGHPLLSPAALAAVRQWAYQPTLLNGVPVSVIMTVTVHFRLRH